MTIALKPAAELAAAVRKPYPNESAEYARARTALLAEEIELRRHIERVAARRRALPPGGEALACPLRDADDRTLTLADVFGESDTLVSYFWMFGPQRPRPCPMCTAFLDAFDQPVRAIRQRVPFVVLGRSPVARQLDFARERGWRHLVFYQVLDDDFARGYRALAPDGGEWPALDVWTKSGGTVRHFWGSELFGTQDPGEDPRGAPDPTPLWNILDLTPAGRGTDWYPRLEG
jgi:predicted dithiol-disulfide oxidoreductase (DUF899 family)